MKGYPCYATSRSRQRGSVLVICMVMAALGTIGVAAWFSLLDARSHQVEATFNALERRVALKNSRALAYQAIYTKHLHSNASLAADTVYTLPGGKGKATVRAFSVVPLKSNTSGPPSRNGATPGSSNTTAVALDLSDGVSETRWTFQLRNTHPALAGDLLTLHSPVTPASKAPLVSGSLRVKGRAVFMDAILADVSSGIKADEFILPNSIVGSTTFSTTADVATLPLNYPLYLRTTGDIGGTAAYKGELEVVSFSANPQNSYEARMAIPSTATLNGSSKQGNSSGTKNRTSTTDESAVLAMIASSPPQTVADELSKQSNLSSTILIAAIQKNNPVLSDSQLLQIFDAQTTVPNDALTELIAKLDETFLTPAIDAGYTDFNYRNGTQFNTNGNGKVKIWLDRSEITQIVVTGVTELTLFGQSNASRASAAATFPPLLVLVDNRGGGVLSKIQFRHVNQRPFVLVIVAAPNAPVVAKASFSAKSAFPEWRAIIDLQNTGLDFDAAQVSGARIIGGIRGNHRVLVSSGTVTLEREFKNITALMPLLSRDAWIEAARN